MAAGGVLTDLGLLVAPASCHGAGLLLLLWSWPPTVRVWLLLRLMAALPHAARPPALTTELRLLLPRSAGFTELSFGPRPG